MPLALVGTVNDRTISYALKEGTIAIGRSAESDLRLEHPSVSRKHAELVVDADGIRISDLGSRNGTVVNGAKITAPTEIHEGDEIKLSDVTLRIVGAQPAAQTIFASDESSVASSSVSVDEMYALGVPKTDDESHNLFRILADAGELLATERPLEELYPAVLDLVERTVSSERTLLLLVEGEGAEPVPVASRLKPGTDDSGLVLSKTMVGQAINQREALLTTDAQQDPRFQAQQSIVSQGIHSAMAAPLFDDENVIGLLYADTTDPASWYTKDELRTFTALANLIAVKITQARLAALEEKRRRIEQELELAERVLSHILPESCEAVSGYEICAFHEPCREVGGDLYDTRQLTDGRYLLLVGDVAGKGFPAALLVSNIMASVQLLTDDPPDLSDMAARLNRQIWRSTDAVHYATLFFGILDPKSGRFDYVNAGHNPPYLVASDGKHEEVAATGLPSGMIEETVYSAGSVDIGTGGLLAVFSDGIPEAQNAEDEFYGEERLLELVRRDRSLPAEAIINGLRTDVDSFVKGCPPSDDVTILLVRRLPK
jgi:serine phosphatase RsbU (regulator of sigma subunit)